MLYSICRKLFLRRLSDYRPYRTPKTVQAHGYKNREMLKYGISRLLFVHS